jgi:hypothetical protein
MRVTDASRWSGWGAFLWAGTLLWLLAVVGNVTAGATLMGALRLRDRWRGAAWAGTIASALLLGALWRSGWGVPGLVVDAAVAAFLVRTRSGARAADPRARGARAGITAWLAAGLVAYLAALILLRPWHVRWGSSDDELVRPMPGDERVARPSYQVQHAVDIAAPPCDVWPWLEQLGHDRAGFYSYAWLENGVGLRIRNADRLHPEWQGLARGDSVFATPIDYLGTGRRFGWRVASARSGRVLELEGWGAFVLEPMPGGSTTLVVRTRGGGSDGLAALVLAPLGLMVMEPAHFVMERRMLLGIRERVEAARGR